MDKSSISQDLEYQSLRQEMLEVGARQFNLVTFSITVSVAMLGFAVQYKEPIVALLPLIILSFSGMQLVNHAYSIMRIASYIAYFLEEGSQGLRWERAMRHLREKKLNFRVWPEYETMLSATGVSCLVISAIVALGQGFGLDFLCFLVVLLFSILYWRWFTIRLQNSMSAATKGELDTKFADLWDEFASLTKFVDMST